MMKSDHQRTVPGSRRHAACYRPTDPLAAGTLHPACWDIIIVMVTR